MRLSAVAFLCALASPAAAAEAAAAAAGGGGGDNSCSSRGLRMLRPMGLPWQAVATTDPEVPVPDALWAFGTYVQQAAWPIWSLVDCVISSGCVGVPRGWAVGWGWCLGTPGQARRRHSLLLPFSSFFVVAWRVLLASWSPALPTGGVLCQLVFFGLVCLVCFSKGCRLHWVVACPLTHNEKKKKKKKMPITCLFVLCLLCVSCPTPPQVCARLAARCRAGPGADRRAGRARVRYRRRGWRAQGDV
jgi:hypothetical protein